MSRINPAKKIIPVLPHLMVLFLSILVVIALDSMDRISNKLSSKELLYAPPSDIKRFAFGYGDAMADSFWIRVLQDIDVCEQNLASDEGARIGAGRIANCNQGWVFHLMDAVIETAPKWRLPAAVGPMILSIVVDDINGASILFKKAVKNFPTDWSILFRAAYHFLYETNDTLLAAKYYDEAGKHGAPMWVHSLSAKLYSENGRDEIAIVVIKDALARTPDGIVKDRLLRRLKLITEKMSNSLDQKRPGKDD